jgi:N-acetylglucosaminyldiphosphoundecaprenol N-acetyl-beta-D-mannosaminyltransferase
VVLEAAHLTSTNTSAPEHPHAPGGRSRIAFGNVLVDNLDLTAAVDRIRGLLVDGRAHQVTTVNLDFLRLAERDPLFLETINQSALAVADGMPLVWLSRLKGEALPERVAGVELVEACCELAAETGAGVFLLGGAEGIADAAGSAIERRFPGLRVVGSYSPPLGKFSPEQDREIVEMIREAEPAFLFVALGAPRQDLWIREHLSELNVSVAMGVGCVLDLHAGVVNRAPAWMRATGLEWAFRLAREPRRLWRRYVLNDMPMLARLLVSAASERRTGSAVPQTAGGI